MNLEAFKEAFPFADNHSCDRNGWGSILRAETKNYLIEYWTESQHGSLDHKKHGFVASRMSLVEIVNFLYIVGEN